LANVGQVPKFAKPWSLKDNPKAMVVGTADDKNVLAQRGRTEREKVLAGIKAKGEERREEKRREEKRREEKKGINVESRERERERENEWEDGKEKSKEASK
jgi:hypothetical protein